MVDDNDQQPGEESQNEIPEAASSAPPRRRRRAASRPAGPPVQAPEGDQVELFVTAEASDPTPPSDLTPPEGDDQPEAPAVDAEADEEPQATATQEQDDEITEPAAAPEPSETPDADPEAEVEAAPAPPKRSRRATRGVTTVAFSAVPEPEPVTTAPAGETSAAALFQPPDETKAVRRTRRSRSGAGSSAERAQAPELADAAEPDDSAEASDEAVDAPEAPDRGTRGTRGTRATRATKDTDDTTDDAQDDDAQDEDARDAESEDGQDSDDERDSDERSDEGAPRRRRRRGGRRRRRPGAASGEGNEGSDDESGETDTDGDGQDSQEQEAAGSEDDSDGDEGTESSSARRRRRRRRRAGVAEEMEDLSSEDPPNTVVKVREARRPKDEITSVRGSTRIEAKKQRRRDGREAGRRRAPILTEAEFLARREAVNRVMCVREHGDRTQIAVLEDGILVEHYVNRAESSSLVGNVYLGKVQNVLPSMEAAFVDIGRGRNAVLYAGEVNWDAAGMEGQPKRIELAMKSGDPVLVQVTKDPIGHKGARLTSQISLPGRFLVYVPEGSMTGISRKLPDTERSRLKGILKDVVPDGAGVIVRTAAEGASEEQLTSDVTRLAEQWADITKKAKSASPPALLYGEPDLAIKVVRDIFNEDFTKLLVQGDSTWETLSEYIGWVAPDLLAKAEKWVESGDLYAAHRIDEQLAKALDRKVWLPSGGSLVIDRTEAMTVVDVNTGKFTGQGGNLEETVTKNNLEAAEEIVRQLRLRDIGGIIVVDFIDMVLESNRDLVLRRLVECLGRDRTKHQVAEVTSLGLVQMTRKRIGQGLLEVFSTPCEHCGGRGHMVSTEPVGGDQPVEEQNNRRERGGRRGAKKSAAPAVLGGKQTGKTPPPPRFDEEGHLEHGENGENAQHGENGEHAEHAQHASDNTQESPDETVPEAETPTGSVDGAGPEESGPEPTADVDGAAPVEGGQDEPEAAPAPDPDAAAPEAGDERTEAVEASEPEGDLQQNAV